jgi:hypothetical protein
MTALSTIIVDGITYVAQQPSTSRAVVVVDRGWIFAGDVREDSGRIYLTNAVWVFKWSGCGFAAVIADPSKADIRPIADLDLPIASEIFRLPVAAEWGLK